MQLVPVRASIYGREKLCYERLRVNGKFYCSLNCRNAGNKKQLFLKCKQCSVEFIRRPSELTDGNAFCTQSCAATYNNLNKTHGCRRSKLELFIEEKIKLEFPYLDFIPNDKSTVSSELDFYFPTLKLAFQINGPTHYKPIFGLDKFISIQRLDSIKRDSCKQQGIQLIEIDCSTDSKKDSVKQAHWQYIRSYLGGQ